LAKFNPYEWSELTMNNPRRIQRHLVRAIAAGALLAAAALPLAIATAAGALTAPTIAFTTTAPAGPGQTNQPGLVDYGPHTTSGTFTITAAATFAGTGTPTFTTTDAQLTFTGVAETSTGSVGGTFTGPAGVGLTPGSYTVTATDATDTAGTTVTFAVVGESLITFDTTACGGISDGGFFGTGSCGTFVLTDNPGPFAGDGGNTTVTTTAPGVTFTGLVNTTGDTITGDFASTAASVPGTYSVTVVDNAGTETFPAAFTIYSDPSVTSVIDTANNTNTASDTTGVTSAPVKLSGAGFVGLTGEPTVVFTSTVDGTSIAATGVAGGGTAETTPTTSLTATFALLNTVDGVQATPGPYTVTVTNADGGSFTSGPLFTVIGNQITAISPSAIVPSTSVATTATLLVSGNGFESGAAVSYTADTGTGCTGVTPVVGSTTVTGAGAITTQVTVAANAGPGLCSVTVTNSGTGGNGASFIATGGLGIKEASALAPVVTASNLTTATALIAGAPATTITFTGLGFSPYTTAGPTLVGANSAIDGDAVITQTANACIASSGTSLTCPIVINSGATAGAHTASLLNGAHAGYFPTSFLVDGPAVTSSTPASLAVHTPIGTVIALTGTGFNNTSGFAGSGITGSTGLAGVLQYVSATAENIVVTTSPTSVGAATFSLQTTDAYGASEVSAPFQLLVGPAPTESAVTYVAGTTGVGVGATAQTVVINGSNFLTGATVTAFVNASGVADTAVTATVVSVNSLGTQITATIAIVSPDVNTVDGFTVTNPDGGVVKALAVAPGGLVIDAAPTVSAVSPATGLASTTDAFTITGTGFATGALVTATSDGTCAAATVASATSITVSCTLGAPQATAVSLVVTNLDGGSATSAVVLPAATPPVKKPAPKPFHVSGVSGRAVVGETVNLVIAGTGFHGQPKIKSSAPGTKAVVSRDTGTRLVIRVTTSAATAPGTKVFTITQSGKVAKIHYVLIKK
jgi:hypothetical protein